MNWGELKTLQQQYLENEEPSFTANRALFTILAEEDIYRQVQLLVTKKKAPVTFTIAVQSVTLPSDWLSTYSLSVTSGTTVSHLLPKEFDFIREAFPTTATGVPRYYALEDDNNMIVGPVPDAGYTGEIYYFYIPASLTEGDTNANETWLSINAQNALLFGSLYHGYVYMKGDQDVIAAYKGQYDKAIIDLKMIAEGRNRKDTNRAPDRRVPT